jgi:hypothetical protein
MDTPTGRVKLSMSPEEIRPSVAWVTSYTAEEPTSMLLEESGRMSAFRDDAATMDDATGSVPSVLASGVGAAGVDSASGPCDGIVWTGEGCRAS